MQSPPKFSLKKMVRLDTLWNLLTYTHKGSIDIMVVSLKSPATPIIPPVPVPYLKRVVDPAHGPVLRVRRQLQGLHRGQLVAVTEVHVLAVDEPMCACPPQGGFNQGGEGEVDDQSPIDTMTTVPGTAHSQLDLGRRRPLPRVASDDVDALELYHARERNVQHQLGVVIVAVQPRLRLSPLCAA